MHDFANASINSFVFCTRSTPLIRNIAAFASIQEDNVIRAYETLEEHMRSNCFQKKFRDLLNYIRDTLIKRHNYLGPSQPLFPIRLWNQYERTENGISLTTNKVEGWHNAFVRLERGNLQNIF
ncbi:hypothetical protein HZS_914 [Henneguya salminicola]|nr:hypothetical protein HZS_914 [Henneguya salminicola]